MNSYGHKENILLKDFKIILIKGSDTMFQWFCIETSGWSETDLLPELDSSTQTHSVDWSRPYLNGTESPLADQGIN